MIDNFNQLVREAQDGSQTALEQLVTALQDRVYNLAMRMLVHPEDAQDASQECFPSAFMRRNGKIA